MLTEYMAHLPLVQRAADVCQQQEALDCHSLLLPFNQRSRCPQWLPASPVLPLPLHRRARASPPHQVSAGSAGDDIPEPVVTMTIILRSANDGLDPASMSPATPSRKRRMLVIRSICYSASSKARAAQAGARRPITSTGGGSMTGICGRI